MRVIRPFFTPEAHPRSRGENAGVRMSDTDPAGSSPLARGKLARVGDARHVGRLIPARAGKTGRGRNAPSRDPAHPRSRGENVAYMGYTTLEEGSSPLARGKPQDACPGGRGLRLIPARAGKTFWKASASSFSGAHPRSRGENPAEHMKIDVLMAHPRSRGENQHFRAST